MDVIFVIFQTGSQANGGVESITQVLEQCPSLRPQVVTQIETVVNQRWQQAGARVTVWPLPYLIGTALLQGGFWHWGQRFWSLVQTNGRMFWRVVRSQAKVVHCNDPSAFWHTAVGARLAGAAVVFNIRDTKADDEPYGWKWTVACWLSSALLVLSHEMRQSLMQALPAARRQAHKLYSIYSIVDTAALSPLPPAERYHLRQRLGIAPDAFAVGYVATCNPKKAQLPLIEQGLPSLRRQVPHLQLYLVGDCEPDNPYARDCVEAAHQLNLDAILTFVGYTPWVIDWYRALDLVIVVSRKEGLARCMIESLACGTPVVSFAVCSAQEILVGYDCGRVVPEGDYAALATAIAALAQQPELRQALGERGIQTAQTLFQPQAIAHQYEEFYATLAVCRGSSPRPLPVQAHPKSYVHTPDG